MTLRRGPHESGSRAASLLTQVFLLSPRAIAPLTDRRFLSQYPILVWTLWGDGLLH
jgi:hypothetical protein